MPRGRARLATLGVGLILLSAWWWIFGAFFPTRAETLGNDYARILPLLLAGSNWFLVNGWLPLPWYTPAFCGGIPLFPHPGSIYASLPQWLSFATDPLTAVRLSVLGFAAASLAGSWLLLRRSLLLSEPAALVGAVVFGFNGFYAHRMLAGHLEFQAFALLPLLGAWLLGPGVGEADRRSAALETLGAAGLLGYLFLSGMGQLLPPVLLSLAAVWLLAGLCVDGARLRVFPVRLAAAGALALALCASRIVSTAAFLSHFPRDFFGHAGLSAALDVGHVLAVLALGGGAVDVAAGERHEHEYGVSPVPFALLLVWGAVAWSRRRGAGGRAEAAAPDARATATWAGLAVVLALPLALNLWSETARSVFQALPGLRSLGTFLRWLLVYPLPLAVASALALERLPRRRLEVAAAAVLCAIGFQAAVDRESYHEQLYPPGPVVAASEKARARGRPEPISRVSATIRDGEIKLLLNRNDVMVEGSSQLACYDPIFGYRLEAFPRGELRPGPVLSARRGVLNLKNPACFVYPDENDCRPGDHFRRDQRAEAESFARYEPFPWTRPPIQRAADALSAVAVVGWVLALLWLAASRLLAGRQSVDRDR